MKSKTCEIYSDFKNNTSHIDIWTRIEYSKKFAFESITSNRKAQNLSLPLSLSLLAMSLKCKHDLNDRHSTNATRKKILRMKMRSMHNRSS